MYQFVTNMQIVIMRVDFPFFFQFCEKEKEEHSSLSKYIFVSIVPAFVGMYHYVWPRLSRLRN